jgi:hypothetical protein
VGGGSISVWRPPPNFIRKAQPSLFWDEVPVVKELVMDGYEHAAHSVLDKLQSGWTYWEAIRQSSLIFTADSSMVHQEVQRMLKAARQKKRVSPGQLSLDI